MRFILVFFLSFITFNAYAEHDFVVYPEPLHAPSSLFEDRYGNLQTLGKFQNKVVILNFWATWCTPCRVEMPFLNQLQKTRENLAIVPLVSMQDDVSKIRSFYRKYKLDELDYFRDNEGFSAESFQVVDVPTSYIFNKQGKLVAYVFGSINWMSKENQTFLDNLLNE